LLDLTRRVIPDLQAIDVTLEFNPETDVEPAVVLWARRPDTGEVDLLPDEQWIRWLIDNFTPDVARQLDLKDTAGAVITAVEPGSIAAEAGLRPGMVIAQVNRQDVHSATEAKTALEKASLDQGVLLLLHTQGGSAFVVLQSSTG